MTLVTLSLATEQSQQKQEVNDHFYSVYDNKENLDEYCTNHNEYLINIEIERTEIRFWLKNDGDSWSGTLSLHDESEKIEEIPVVVEGDEVVIQAVPERRVSTDILFFNQFDTEKCTITEISPQVLFEPCLEEVLGEYPEDEI